MRNERIAPFPRHSVTKSRVAAVTQSVMGAASEQLDNLSRRWHQGLKLSAATGTA
jgi:hypothetical protein